MSRTLFALAALALTVTLVHAGESKASFPAAPVGFDDGRVQLEKELNSSGLTTSLVLERALDEATPGELASLLLLRLAPDELASLDTFLSLKGALPKQATVEGMQQTLIDAKLGSKEVAQALGELLTRRAYSPLDAGAWLYNRGYNARVISGALDRGTNAARKMRAFLESAKSAKSREIFERAFWEFDLRDASGIAGGHYDSEQLIEAIFDIGMDEAGWVHAFGRAEGARLNANEKRLIDWADAGVIAPSLEARVSERDLFDAACAYLEAQNKRGVSIDALRQCALRRSFSAQRWFRTAGSGVLAVYRGPWSSKLEAPTTSALGVGDLYGTEFGAALSDEVSRYFDQKEETITLVIYEDGSARAIVKLAQTLKYDAESPLGKSSQPYLLLEGRASARGKNALLSPVFQGNNKLAFTEIDISGFGVTANKAFAYGEAAYGKTDKSLLLRRVSRNVAFE
jgi:hypothetical protein